MMSVVQRITDSRIVAIIRAASPEAALEVGQALIEEGIDVVEVSLTTPRALTVIENLVDIPGACVGAGTVLTAEEVEACTDAGASFVVAPNCDEQVIEAARGRQIPIAAGVFTASECARALRAGAPFLKLFPASVGGIALMKALSAPFPGVRWLPTGGIDTGNAADWWAAGASAVGVGGSLTSGEIEAVRENARAFRSLAHADSGRD